jgi:hypothetical protein
MPTPDWATLALAVVTWFALTSHGPINRLLSAGADYVSARLELSIEVRRHLAGLPPAPPAPSSAAQPPGPAPDLARDINGQPAR